MRVVVITGTGDTFSAGADLKMVAAGNSDVFITKRGGFAGFVARDFPKPVVAAVNGTAVAGGFEIALACDLIVAAEGARFGLFEVRRGLFAGGGGLIRLPRRVSLALAMELAIMGNAIDARRAYEVGLVNRVVPAPEVVECRTRPRHRDRRQLAPRGPQHAADGPRGGRPHRGRGVEAQRRAVARGVRVTRLHRGRTGVRREAPAGLADVLTEQRESPPWETGAEWTNRSCSASDDCRSSSSTRSSRSSWWSLFIVLHVADAFSGVNETVQDGVDRLARLGSVGVFVIALLANVSLIIQMPVHAAAAVGGAGRGRARDAC